MVTPPMFMVLGWGVYLLSMMDAACVRRPGGMTLSTPLYSNCWRMYCGFVLLGGRLGSKLGLGWGVVGLLVVHDGRGLRQAIGRDDVKHAIVLQKLADELPVPLAGRQAGIEAGVGLGGGGVINVDPALAEVA